MHIGIVGGGFVGSATALLACTDIQVTVYDLDPTRCSPPGTKMRDLLVCDLVFVCVPTPTYENGSCNTTIVERCVRSLQEAGIHNIILRSTVPPGTSEQLQVSAGAAVLLWAARKAHQSRCLQESWPEAAV